MIKNSKLIKELLVISSENSTNGYIAKNILIKMNEFQNFKSSYLADLTHTSQSQISKFVAKMGYEKFIDFKEELLLYRQDDKEIKTVSSTKELDKSIINFINSVPKKIYKDIAKKIVNSKKIIILATGSSKRVSAEFCTSLSRMSKSVSVHQDFATSYSEMLTLDKESLVISISMSGVTNEIVLLSQLAKTKNCEIIAITGNENNELSKISDYIFVIYKYGFSQKNLIQSNSVFISIILSYILQYV